MLGAGVRATQEQAGPGPVHCRSEPTEGPAAGPPRLRGQDTGDDGPWEWQEEAGLEMRQLLRGAWQGMSM